MPNNSGALIITPHSTIPFERFLFGNENWRSHRAICEMEIYCDLLENLQDRIDSLETRGKDEEVALTNVQAVISSYAFEIALKSFWALDNPAECVPHSHEVTSIFDELKEETKKSLKQFQLTEEVVDYSPKPFQTNRYSMECGDRHITVYPSQFLRPLVQELRDKLKASREAVLKPPQSS